MTLNITDGELNSLNGCLPVKIYNRVWMSGDENRGARRQTSITTIPNEKMSASRVILLAPLRISGAVHLAVYPSRWLTRAELIP